MDAILNLVGAIGKEEFNKNFIPNLQLWKDNLSKNFNDLDNKFNDSYNKINHFDEKLTIFDKRLNAINNIISKLPKEVNYELLRKIITQEAIKFFKDYEEIKKENFKQRDYIEDLRTKKIFDWVEFEELTRKYVLGKINKEGWTGGRLKQKIGLSLKSKVSGLPFNEDFKFKISKKIDEIVYEFLSLKEAKKMETVIIDEKEENPIKDLNEKELELYLEWKKDKGKYTKELLESIGELGDENCLLKDSKGNFLIDENYVSGLFDFKNVVSISEIIKVVKKICEDESLGFAYLDKKEYEAEEMKVKLKIKEIIKSLTLEAEEIPGENKQIRMGDIINGAEDEGLTEEIVREYINEVANS